MSFEDKPLWKQYALRNSMKRTVERRTATMTDEELDGIRVFVRAFERTWKDYLEGQVSENSPGRVSVKYLRQLLAHIDELKARHRDDCLSIWFDCVQELDVQRLTSDGCDELSEAFHLAYAERFGEG